MTVLASVASAVSVLCCAQPQPSLTCAGRVQAAVVHKRGIQIYQRVIRAYDTTAKYSLVASDCQHAPSSYTAAWLARCLEWSSKPSRHHRCSSASQFMQACCRRGCAGTCRRSYFHSRTLTSNCASCIQQLVCTSPALHVSVHHCFKCLHSGDPTQT